MTAKQLQDEALTLLLAGYETTAVALTWTWYLLAQHPAVEATCRRNWPRGSAAACQRLRLPPPLYTRMALTAAMRLTPQPG